MTSVAAPLSPVPAPAETAAQSLTDQYRRVRGLSLHLIDPLTPEDCVVQSMPDASPTKWHLAHTTWFFETLVLQRFGKDYKLFNEKYQYLFNSYYNSLGAQYPRPKRGLVSRPTVDEVIDYRLHVDEHMESLLEECTDDATLRDTVTIGLHHEQQHQELLLTDIKHMFSFNPLFPVYRERPEIGRGKAPELRWSKFDEGIYEIGYDGAGFAYDNEGPRHKTYLNAFQIASRPVTNGEYLAFMGDHGYETATLWLSEGWGVVQQEGWRHPLYWLERDDGWYVYTLNGLQQVNPDEPASHLSYYEADAFARWAGARLPREEEWEAAACNCPVVGNFVESELYHPAPAAAGASSDLCQCFGDVWEWTASPYTAYPGYRPVEGALGEYNGKFMCNQLVLRGGSCATSSSHIRATYRNFFPAYARWQFSGLRLAKDGQ